MFNINFFPTQAAIGGLQDYATFVLIDIAIWPPYDGPSIISI
jgi:hypothetical protein